MGILGVLLVAGGALAGCGDDDDTAGDGGPQVVVTTNILGDMVREVIGDGAEVDVVMPLGADPHEFAASTQQAEAMLEADLLVVNGAHFEEGLEGVIDRAEEAGVPRFSFADQIELLPFSGPADEDGDAHTDDPHLWTDPARMATAVEQLGPALAELDGIDGTDVEARATAYAEELRALDQEIETMVAPIPAERRVLITNHEVFGYFAERYDLEVVGTVIPSGTTLAEPSSAELEDLAGVIREHRVPAIFAETTRSTQLAEALAESVGAIEVVTLYTESLGEEGSGAETYVGLMRTDAQLIVDALA